jgi:hypothetical protein
MVRVVASGRIPIWPPCRVEGLRRAPVVSDERPRGIISVGAAHCRSKTGARQDRCGRETHDHAHQSTVPERLVLERVGSREAETQRARRSPIGRTCWRTWSSKTCARPMYSGQESLGIFGEVVDEVDGNSQLQRGMLIFISSWARIPACCLERLCPGELIRRVSYQLDEITIRIGVKHNQHPLNLVTQRLFETSVRQPLGHLSDARHLQGDVRQNVGGCADRILIATLVDKVHGANAFWTSDVDEVQTGAIAFWTTDEYFSYPHLIEDDPVTFLQPEQFAVKGDRSVEVRNLDGRVADTRLS